MPSFFTRAAFMLDSTPQREHVWSSCSGAARPRPSWDRTCDGASTSGTRGLRRRCERALRQRPLAPRGSHADEVGTNIRGRGRPRMGAPAYLKPLRVGSREPAWLRPSGWRCSAMTTPDSPSRSGHGRSSTVTLLELASPLLRRIGRDASNRISANDESNHAVRERAVHLVRPGGTNATDSLRPRLSEGRRLATPLLDR